MKKLILPILVIFLSLLATAFLLPQEINAQTDSECFREYQNEGYKCLQTRTKCVQSCSNINNLKACHDSCSAQDKTCSEQASADLTACKAAIKKDNKKPTETKESPEVETNTDCHEAFNQESNSCLKESTKCLNSCVDKASEAMSLTVDGGKVNLECQRNVCDPASKVCNNKAKANFKTCLDAREAKDNPPKKAVKEEKSPLAKVMDMPVFVGEWFRTLSDWISLGEFAIGMKEVASNLTIADDAIIADEEEEKEWDQYYKSYNSLKSQGYTHEQIGATLQKPRRRDVSMSPQELDALKARFPAGESITNVAGATNTKLYSWEADSGALIKSTNWEKIEFKQPVVKDSVTIRTVKLEEGEIEVKVRNNKPAENQFGIDAGWLGVTVSRTHFRVLNDRINKSAVVIVYEGEVEVKTRDGKTVKVRPDGDKPGVVGVSQKLSPIKLAITGLVFLGIIGVMVYILKRKFFAKGSIKKRR